MRTMFQWTHEMLTHVPCGLKMDDKTCIDKTNDQLSCFSPVPNCLGVPAVCSVSVCTSASKSSIQRFVITTRAFSWLKAATTAFTFKTLLKHYAKQALTPRSLNVKLGPRRNYHKGRAAIRHYANQTARPLWPFALRTQYHVERPWGQRLFCIVF